MLLPARRDAIPALGSPSLVANNQFTMSPIFPGLKSSGESAFRQRIGTVSHPMINIVFTPVGVS
jgi:hypothetical protein